MLSELRKALSLVEPARRPRYAALVFLVASVAVLESLGALLVFGLLSVATGGGESIALPLIGTPSLIEDLSRRELVLWGSAFVAAFFILRGAAYLVQNYWQNRVAQEEGANLATTLFEGYLHLPYGIFVRRNSSELIRNIQQATEQFSSGVLVPAIGIASEGLIVLAVLVILVFKAPAIAGLGAILVVPLVLLLLKIVRPRLVALGTQNQDYYELALRDLQEAFRGVRDVRLLRKEKFFINKFQRSRRVLAYTYYMRALMVDAPRVIVETILVLLILALLALSTGQAGSLDRAVPLLGLFAYVFLRSLPALNRIMAHINTLRFGMPSVNLLLTELAGLDAIVTRSEPDATPLPLDTQIRLVDVSFAYDPGQPVLHDVSLEIRRGEIVGFVGPTGSGKSTLIDLLVGLLDPTAGSLLVDGFDVTRDLSRWQQNVALVPQTTFLLDDSIRANIAFGDQPADIDEARVSKAAEHAMLSGFLDGLPDGLETHVGESGIRLSGGQRQRIAIARALYRQPKVLVLDEGTSALDPVTESQLLHGLDSAREDLTTVIVAHRMTTIRACSRIHLIEDGRLVASGSYDELARDSRLFRRFTQELPED